MWGIHGVDGEPHVARRFIPTHVGNTPAPQARRPPPSVHPHACGEYRLRRPMMAGTCGSSPRMWGILIKSLVGQGIVRFIPTHVGNTSTPSPARGPLTVHPHACGEYNRISARRRRPCGSSPRMWGIRWTVSSRCRDFRFIPTHVGNTLKYYHVWFAYTVHPHACGEYTLRSIRRRRFLGSSPRMWGILFRKMQEITDCWQSSSVLPSHACCKPAPMTIKRGRSFVKRLLPLVKHCPAGQSRSLDVTCPDRRNARLRS